MQLTHVTKANYYYGYCSIYAGNGLVCCGSGVQVA